MPLRPPRLRYAVVLLIVRHHSTYTVAALAVGDPLPTHPCLYTLALSGTVMARLPNWCHDPAALLLYV